MVRTFSNGMLPDFYFARMSNAARTSPWRTYRTPSQIVGCAQCSLLPKLTWKLLTTSNLSPGFARPSVPRELVSILNKVMTGIDQSQLQEMFLADEAERQVVHRVFGLTGDELARLLVWTGAAVLALIFAYAAGLARVTAGPKRPHLDMCPGHTGSLLSCPALCDPLGYGLPGFSVQGLLQTRMLECIGQY